MYNFVPLMVILERKDKDLSVNSEDEDVVGHVSDRTQSKLLS